MIGATETMTTAFAAITARHAALVSAIRWREPARLLVSGAMAAAIFATFVLFTLPTFNYYRITARTKAARRLVTEKRALRAEAVSRS